MARILDSLSIEGFKSIREMRELPLTNINVLIGPNGVGKSNFIGFFRLLRAMIDERLQVFVRTQGGENTFLYMGAKVTKRIIVKMRFGPNGYDFTLRFGNVRTFLDSMTKEGSKDMFSTRYRAGSCITFTIQAKVLQCDELARSRRTNHCCLTAAILRRICTG
jgi:predicted ATPase